MTAARRNAEIGNRKRQPSDAKTRKLGLDILKSPSRKLVAFRETDHEIRPPDLQRPQIPRQIATPPRQGRERYPSRA